VNWLCREQGGREGRTSIDSEETHEEDHVARRVESAQSTGVTGLRLSLGDDEVDAEAEEHEAVAHVAVPSRKREGGREGEMSEWIVAGLTCQRKSDPSLPSSLPPFLPPSLHDSKQKRERGSSEKGRVGLTIPRNTVGIHEFLGKREGRREGGREGGREGNVSNRNKVGAVKKEGRSEGGREGGREGLHTWKAQVKAFISK